MNLNFDNLHVEKLMETSFVLNLADQLKERVFMAGSVTDFAFKFK